MRRVQSAFRPTTPTSDTFLTLIIRLRRLKKMKEQHGYTFASQSNSLGERLKNLLILA